MLGTGQVRRFCVFDVRLLPTAGKQDRTKQQSPGRAVHRRDGFIFLNLRNIGAAYHEP